MSSELSKGVFGEERIGESFGGFPLFKVRRKRYRCTQCGTRFETETNHYTTIYTCPQSRCMGPSECIELDLGTMAERELENRSE